jgi:Skp family chaperone for outer membrane proteins
MNATLLRAALAAGALSMLATTSLAQGAAAPAEAPWVQGPTVPGLCVFTPQGVVEASKVGQSVLARLKLLNSNVQAEMQPEGEALQAEQKSIQAAAQTAADQSQLKVRADNWEVRYQNYQKKGQLRGQEMQATQKKQFDIILKQLQPILKDLYQQHHCSVLLNADTGAVSEVAPAMDLSREAAAQLDLKIQSLTFDREHLDQAGAPGR